MGTCQYCGRAIDPAAQFCPFCGQAVAVQPSGQSPVPTAVSPPATPTPSVAPVQPPPAQGVAYPTAAAAPEGRSGALVVAIAVLAGVIVIGALALSAVAYIPRLTMRDEASAGVVVPDVKGLTAEQASERLEEAGLVAAQFVYDPDAVGAVGAVVSATPAPGDSVQPGTSVSLTIAGEEPVKVPRFIGLTEGGGKAAAAAVGLKPVIAQKRSPKKKGTIISQEPSSGAMVQPGSKVTLLVSTGPAIKKPTKKNTSRSSSGSGIWTPRKGSAERTAIMDACRVYLGYSGLFTVHSLQVRGSRAYAHITPYDDPAWGSIKMYLMRSGGGWVVRYDSRTSPGISRTGWLYNR